MAFKYERPLDFCYACGKLGHSQIFCTLLKSISKVLPYEPWISAENPYLHQSQIIIQLSPSKQSQEVVTSIPSICQLPHMHLTEPTSINNIPQLSPPIKEMLQLLDQQEFTWKEKGKGILLVEKNENPRMENTQIQTMN